MAKKLKEVDSQFAAVEETLTNTEQWIEKNQKKLMIVVFSIIGVITIYMGYQKMIVEPANKEALAELFIAEKYFENASYDIALNGDGQYLGFLDIVSDYKNTDAGNLANYYAGISYLNLGNNENAIKFLSNFESNDEIISSIALGSLGDAYMNINEKEKGIVYYEKAANNSQNKFTTPIYLKKAGLAHEDNGDYQSALINYEKIKSKYQDTQEASDIDKYITRASLTQ